MALQCLSLCVKFICFGFPNDCSILGLLELRQPIILSDGPTGCPQTQLQNKLSFLTKYYVSAEIIKTFISVKFQEQFWLTPCSGVWGASIRNPLLTGCTGWILNTWLIPSVLW